MKKTDTFSPVVRADVTFYGPPPLLCVDVRFRNSTEINRFISLSELTRIHNELGR
jgi:hypothetical protein